MGYSICPRGLSLLTPTQKTAQLSGFLIRNSISDLLFGLSRLGWTFTSANIFNHLAGFNTGSTNSYLFRNAINQSSYILKIRQKTPFGFIMGVGYVVSRNRFLSTYFTNFSHRIQKLLSRPKPHKLYIFSEKSRC